MARMFGETRVVQHLLQVVALAAHSVRTGGSEVRSRKQVRNCSARSDSLAEFIATFEQVPVPGAVWAIGSLHAELAVVIAVMAIGT